MTRTNVLAMNVAVSLRGMSTHARIAAVVLAALVSVGGLGACSGGSDVGTAVSASAAVTNVNASDAVKVLAESDITVIDVRTPTEYGSGHLSGAVTAQMAELGFTKIYNLQGGITDWQANGGAVVTS